MPAVQEWLLQIIESEWVLVYCEISEKSSHGSVVTPVSEVSVLKMYYSDKGKWHLLSGVGEKTYKVQVPIISAMSES